MRSKVDTRIVVVAFTGLGLALGSMRSHAQTVGTAFTYQGRLNDAGSPATGAYDLQLVLFDTAVGGAQVGPILVRDDVAVSNGLFTVSLDFGGVFAGSKRWLEVGVRPGASTGAYSTLSPRQELAPSPNAVFSATAPWTGITAKPAGFADGIDNDVLGGLSCTSGQIAKWNGAIWACAADADSGGDITAVAAGSGLTGGGTTGAVTLAVEPTLVQTRVSSTCAAGSSIRVVNQDGTVVCQADATGADWGLRGNAGTNPAENFIGTTDNQAFELRANNLRGLRIEQVIAVVGATTYAGANVVGGSSNNSITPGVSLATIAGGGGAANGGAQPNTVTDIGGTVGGGWANQAGDGAGTLDDRGAATVGGGTSNRASGGTSTIAGGAINTASANYSAVAGGLGNTASGGYSAVAGGTNNAASGGYSAVAGGGGNTASGSNSAVAGGGDNWASGLDSAVAGGWSNTASGIDSAVAGGSANRASGVGSAVAGGLFNIAGGDGSFAAGWRAIVRDATASGDVNGDEGTFVWADSLGSFFTSTGPNQFLIRAAGGVGINTNSPSPGGLTVAAPGKLTFGSQTRQMIDLWGPGGYGIGVQAGTQYYRVQGPGGGFAWFNGGTHSDIQNDPGTGGVREMRLDGAGNLFVRGTVNPGGADFAEMLAAEEGLEPGDVLAIGPDGQLIRSTVPYQDSLAGVYSTKPGLVGGAADGESAAGEAPLAMAGVVPVKVTDEGGPIVPGDALTSSSTPGHAMKAAKVRVGGVAFFPSGVVIGKALDRLTAGKGVIRALVVLQ